MIGLLVALLILCLICTAVWYITNLPGVPPFVRPIAYVVVCIFAILWLVSALPSGSLGFHRLG